MAKFPSETADKFMVRFADDESRNRVKEAASREHIPMNSYILQAIDEKLERGRRMDQLLDRIEELRLK